MYAGLIKQVFKYAWDSRGNADKRAILETYRDLNLPVGTGPLGELSERVIANDIGGAL